MTETSTPVVALRAAADADLSALTELLWREQTPHRVVTQDEEQLLLVLDVEAARHVQALAASLARAPHLAGRDAGYRADARADDGGWWPRVWTWMQWARKTPSTTAVIVLALLCAPVSLLGEPSAWLNTLFIVSPTAWTPAEHWTTSLQQLTQTLAGGEVWRLLTPCLLHFSLMHLVMDVFLFWEFGQRLERVLSSSAILTTMVAIGVASNVGQFLVGGTPEFGGLSGVVTGQLGMILMLGRRSTAECLRLPSALSTGVLLSLLIMSTGVTEYFGLYIANTAHWVGLAAGAMLGWLWPLPEQPHFRPGVSP